MTYKGVKWCLANWKNCIHITFRTYHFGVNNQWWVGFNSIFGLPWYKRFHIFKEYQCAKIRAISIGFLDPYICAEIWPKETKKTWPMFFEGDRIPLSKHPENKFRLVNITIK